MFDDVSGPALAAELAGLAVPGAERLVELSDADLLGSVRGWDRLVAWAQAGQAAALAEVAHRATASGDYVDGEGVDHSGEFVGCEIAPLLHLSRMAAEGRLSVALGLVDRPGLARAWREGRIDQPKVRAVLDALTGLAPDVADQIERRALDAAPRITVHQLRARLTRWLLTLDPDGETRRRQHVNRQTRVTCEALPDGLGLLSAYGPADVIAGLYQTLDADARVSARGGLDPADLTMGQRRFEALTDRVLRTADGRPSVQVQLTVSAATVLGLDATPGELAGYGAIPAEMARELARGDATWRRILTDPTSGRLLEVGRTTYEPPAALRRHVQGRDRTCRFPGCRQPAHRVDLDHTVPYPEGPTTSANLGCLCRFHHRLKHQKMWRLEQRGDGHFVWHSPMGQLLLVDPPPLLDTG